MEPLKVVAWDTDGFGNACSSGAHFVPPLLLTGGRDLHRPGLVDHENALVQRL